MGLLTIRCGIYSFSGSTLPSHLKTVGVPIFENRTAEFGIDQQITDIIIDAIRREIMEVVIPTSSAIKDTIGKDLYPIKKTWFKISPG